MSEQTQNFFNSAQQSAPSGFSFSNAHRNATLSAAASAASGKSTPVRLAQAKKTGTTIVGMVYAGGVILGADTRATSGEEVAEKNCQKIHYLAPNMYCAGAGTAADTDKTTELISSQLALLRLDTHLPSRVVTALTLLKRMLFRYQGHVSAALILGGVDVQGPHVYHIYPHGSTSKLSYATMGSGSVAAMSVFETSWRDGLTEDEGIEMVKRAVSAGVFNDLGSGSNIDLCIMRMDGTVDYRRNEVKPNEIGPLRAMVQRSGRMNLVNGATPILHSAYAAHPTLADVDVMEVEAT
jgi:20S proteasome subunit beta 2